MIAVAVVALIVAALAAISIRDLESGRPAAAASTGAGRSRVVAAPRTLTGDVILYQDNIQKIVDDGGAIEQDHATCGGTGALSVLGIGAPVTVRDGRGATLATGWITSATWISITTSRTAGADAVPGRTLDGVTLPGVARVPPQTVFAGFCDLGFTVGGVPAAPSYSITVPLGDPAVFSANELDSAHWHATFGVSSN